MSEVGHTPGLDAGALEPWLRDHLPSASPPFEYRVIAGGHSNITYRMVGANGQAFVLRRPPLGTQPPGAHDVAREFRIQSALRPTDVPVPHVELLCEDTSVLGAPFYVMRWVDGVVVDSPSRATEALPNEQLRRAAAVSAVKTLAAIHKVDIDAANLSSLGARDNFVARQTERMRRVWEKVKTREFPLIVSLYERLVALRPTQKYTGLVHNDYRLGNLMLSRDGEVNAVLDWELAAVGDVLVDVGALVNNWDGPDETGPDIWMRPAPTRAGGFPSRDDIVASYVRCSGFDVSDLDYYRALSYWRNAVIGEGMKRRYESGEMPGGKEIAVVIERKVQERAEIADAFLR